MVRHLPLGASHRFFCIAVHVNRCHKLYLGTKYTIPVINFIKEQNILFLTKLGWEVFRFIIIYFTHSS